MTYLLMLAAAAVLLFWPTAKQPAARPYPLSPAETKPPAKPNPTYQSALVALSQVRLRLLVTEELDDQQREAIDTLTLALVSGSDKE